MLLMLLSKKHFRNKFKIAPQSILLNSFKSRYRLYYTQLTNPQMSDVHNVIFITDGIVLYGENKPIQQSSGSVNFYLNFLYFFPKY